jgi:DNA-binding transcriptional LysR family regulator
MIGVAMEMIDPGAVQAFVLAAELRSFTKAAQRLNSTQSAVSTRLKKLEDRLGVKLLERTPRAIRLTTEGERFLGLAVELLKAHQRAGSAFGPERPRLRLGLTHHLAGPRTSPLLAAAAGRDPDLVLELATCGTRELLQRYDDGELDAVIVLRHGESRRHGESLGFERFFWVGVPGLGIERGPVPLAAPAAPCAIRAMATNALESAGIAWKEAFIGSSAYDILAAVQAGLGIAVVAASARPDGPWLRDGHLPLPGLPVREVILHSNVSNARAKAVLKEVATTLRCDCDWMNAKESRLTPRHP